MKVRHIPCGPFANRSERYAADYLKTRLISAPGESEWVLLTNLSSTSGVRGLSEEFDLVAIGPSGVHPIEIKHWDGSYLRQEASRAEQEAKKLNAKVRRLAGYLRRAAPSLGFLGGRFLLTKGNGEKFVEGGARRTVAGIEVFGLTEWSELLQLSSRAVIDQKQAVDLAKLLEPGVAVSLGAEPRSFANYIDLVALGAPQDSFHRLYRARRRLGRDRVVLHVYDLSASANKNARDIARREFEALQKLQKSKFLPSLMDSFQEAPQYPGELYFFSYVDTEAAPLAERLVDPSWTAEARLRTAARCLDALTELHGHSKSGDDPQVLHRNLTPDSIRVRSNGEPLLTNLQFAKIEGVTTIAGSVAPEFVGKELFVAPEVRRGGLEACSVASDVYAICASLSAALDPVRSDTRALRALEILAEGMREDSEARPALTELVHGFAQLPVEGVIEATPVPVEFWDEDTVVAFRHRHYRIMQRLGSGSVGTTFKVMEVDAQTLVETSGPYVAKAITAAGIGEAATQAYAKVRAQTGEPHLAGVLEVTHEWRAGELTALLRWVEGQPLSDLRGVLPLYLEELQETGEDSDFQTAVLWLQDLCEGLTRLHKAGLVHGDVSPKNIIVHGRSAILTDYDLARIAGTPAIGGTSRYCSSTVDRRESISPSDDIFALAATFFEILFDATPFEFPHGQDKTRGFPWRPEWRPPPAGLRAFLDRAVHPDRARRFGSASEALVSLKPEASPLTSKSERGSPEDAAAQIPQLTDNEVPWLMQLLRSYSGSPKGNAETRGLDSEFARGTYVDTPLDDILEAAIRSRRIGLVVLCGNAGDGKTAFLQRLAKRLGCPELPSSLRLWEHVLPDGLMVRANLDGSASFLGRSAVEILDEFLRPFASEAFPPNLVHLLAINDGPLMSWLDHTAESWLAEQLGVALTDDTSKPLDPRIRFIDLNDRSLVGSAGREGGFLDQLLVKLLGHDTIWKPCVTCTAQARCSARESVQVLRDPELGPNVRRRLQRALQAVHVRGEVHVTARGLRSALAYLFFGSDYCTDLHKDPNHRPLGYYERAFSAASPYRQGELLAELVLLDPAIEAHPRIDRELLRSDSATTLVPPSEGGVSRLAALRRRAYFEWSAERIASVAGHPSALGLARGQHLEMFLQVAAGTSADREAICSDLCRGIARLEDLPEAAFRDSRWVPLRITPRTPTETVLWVNKLRSRFNLFARSARAVEGLDALHTHVVLRYAFASGHYEDLIIGAELFHLLLELRNGYQISDAASDDVFANLSIFKQRLAQEDDRELLAWNPLADTIYRVSTPLEAGVRILEISRAGSEAEQ